VADLGLRFSEGIQELKLEQQLAPAREAVSQALTAGSTNFFRAVEGVRGRWQQRQSANAATIGPDAAAATAAASGSSGASITSSVASSTTMSTPTEISRSEAELAPPKQPAAAPSASGAQEEVRRLSVSATQGAAAVSGWGTGIGSFFASRWGGSTGGSRAPTPSPNASPAIPAAVPKSPTLSTVESLPPVKEKDGQLAPKDQDERLPGAGRQSEERPPPMAGFAL
jgi:hypothetical protein